jgi:tight adherence protein B
VIVLPLMKMVGYLCLFGAMTLMVMTLLTRADLGPNRLVRSYVIHLDGQFHDMQMPGKGMQIAIGQFVALVVIALVIGHYGPNQWFAGVVAVVLFGPMYWLKRTMDKRRVEIELQLNGFNLALANALRASPSLGKALQRAEDVAQGPMAAELQIVLKELRLGATVDQSLLNLAARVGSPNLDAIISALLIGRQIGGRVPDILESTAETLREMERLEGVIRTKTSEAKGQLWVMGLAPPAIFVLFDHMKPGYFDPLTDSLTGLVLLGFAILCWVGSVVMARSILNLEI